MTIPHFTAIRIVAFRGLRNVRLDGLSRVNIITGKNNAGKTSVLEAIAACCHPVDGKSWLDMVMRRGSRKPIDEQFRRLFPSTVLGRPAQDVEMYYDRVGSPFQWHVVGQLAQQEEIAPLDAVDTDDPLVSATRTVTRVTLSVEAVGVPESNSMNARSEFNLRSGEFVPKVWTAGDVSTVSVTSQTHRSEAFQIDLMAGVDELPAREKLLSLLQQFDDNVEQLEIFDPKSIRSSIRVWHKKTGPTPIAVFGDGFRRILTYALALFRCRHGGVLLIDEIETALHYSALRDVYAWLVRACEEYDVQLFVTTHSLEAIDALLDATPEQLDTTFFRLYDVGQGPQVLRFSEADLRTLRYELGDEVRG